MISHKPDPNWYKEREGRLYLLAFRLRWRPAFQKD